MSFSKYLHRRIKRPVSKVERPPSYNVEKCFIALMAGPMVYTISLTSTFHSNVKDRYCENVITIILFLTVLQTGRILLEGREKTVKSGYSRPAKSILELLINMLIFISCYSSTYQVDNYARLTGFVVAVLILYRIVKYRIYDDLFRHKIHDPRSKRHNLKDNAGHFLMRVFLGMTRSYLYTAFAFSVMQMQLMTAPFGDPWALNMGNQSGNPMADFFYFNIVTIATVGYGDIYPKSAFAKLLCCSEIMFSFLILGMIVATLLGRFQVIASQPGRENT